MADALNCLDYTLGWIYVYDKNKRGIICKDMATSAWYRVPNFTLPPTTP